MVVSKSSWEKLAELWKISEAAAIVSKALISLYMVNASLYRAEINLETLRDNLEACRKLFERIIQDLNEYMAHKIPETELITLLIEAFGNIDIDKIRKRIETALQSLLKINEAVVSRSLNKDLLEEKNIIELKETLKILSAGLSGKVEQTALSLRRF